MVRLEKSERIGLIRIDRPEAMNSLNEQVLTELSAAVMPLRLIPGIGDHYNRRRKGICCRSRYGMQPLDAKGGYERGRLGQKVFRKIETLKTGHCRG